MSTDRFENSPVSDALESFRARFFPDAALVQWHSWKWQLQHRIDTVKKLRRILELTESESAAFHHGRPKVPFAITPYYMGVVATMNSDNALRKSMVPTDAEFRVNPGESRDPLVEEKQSPVPAIVHRYPDRVLFLTTHQCAVYCRYCTRARIFSRETQAISRTRHWKEGLAYIAATKSIREVIVSGGDPLILENDSLKGLLAELRKISHVQIIRLGTKIPVSLPQRITDDLLEMLRSFHPLILSLHVIHPDELTREAAFAIERLADAGIVIGSQTVLLKTINDSTSVIQKLMENLLRLRVRPYALFQCDPILGSDHFRTSLDKGIEIIEDLRRQTSGYAIPHFIADPPGGKVTLAPNTIVAKTLSGYRLKNWRGEEIEYPDPSSGEP
ncbi:MAG: KamA family radical SAM protein [bacterium]